ncbi:MAG: hypothetical protein HC880_00160 [Bacteroidia bacterium]|nr:hypothetical protein [Bacteroidia bacterium]
MRAKSNFNDLIAETYRIIEESKKAREGAEKELKRAWKTSYQDVHADNITARIPGFGGKKLR